MERIPVGTTKIDKAIDLERAAKKRLTQSFFNYSGIIVSAFLMFVVILVVTTDIRLEIKNLAHLGLDFFLLLFCSYAAYILCADSGEKRGTLTDEYLAAQDEFETWLDEISAKSAHCVLGDFCAEYIKTDLRNARMNYLTLAGITYDEYEEKYLNLDDSKIDKLTTFSEAQRKALKEANSVKPITLRPDQILGRVHGVRDRSPLGIAPTTKKHISYGVKFVTISLISLGMVLIGLNSIETSPWLIFVTICFKMGSVLFNCFDGYKAGYESKAVYTVNYMRQQVSLMKQALVYSEQHKDEKGVHTCADTAREGADN